MAEYIEREAAIKRFNFAVLDCLGMEPTIRAGDIIKALESIPAADVREVKRGKWVYNDDDNIPYCSECIMPQDIECNFCPNCGADMRGGKLMIPWIYSDLDTIIDSYSEPPKEE